MTAPDTAFAHIDLGIAPAVAIIVVNWNGYADTLRCLKSLAALEDRDIRIIVCDNGSTDRSVELLMEWAGASAQRIVALDRASIGHHPVSVVDIGRNGGFAAANNTGIEIALSEPSIQAVWLLNNDTEVPASSLSALRRRIGDDAGIGICGSTIVNFHNRKIVQSLGVRHRLALGYGVSVGDGISIDELPDRGSVEREITYVQGASMLVTRRFLECVGLMNESYFLYCEELDWCLRNGKRFKIGWAPDSIVYHKEGASIGTRYKGRPSDLSIYYQNVNILRVAARYMPAALPLILLRLIARMTRYALGKDFRAARIVFIAMADFSTNRRRSGGSLLPRGRA